MKVKELIDILNKQDPEAIVIQSKDEEGNGFSPTYEIRDALYVEYSAFSGEVYPSAKDPYYKDNNEELPDDADPCVVLWPTN